MVWTNVNTYAIEIYGSKSRIWFPENWIKISISCDSLSLTESETIAYLSYLLTQSHSRAPQDIGVLAFLDIWGGLHVQGCPDLYLEVNRLWNSFFSDSRLIVGLFWLRTRRNKMILWYRLTIYSDSPSRIEEKWVWKSVYFQVEINPV